MDGLSSDGTVSLLKQFAAESPWITFVSEADCGVYDAINKAIIACRGDYYVVAGADDEFRGDALEKYSNITLSGSPDVVLARTIRSGKVIGGFYPSRAWIGHSKAFPVSHSIGMLFKKTLHDTFGPYSRRFPMLADGYFLKRLITSDAVFVDANFIAGNFSDGGMSSVNKLQTLTETWHVQMLTERFKLIQTLMFIGKVIWRYPSVIKELRRNQSVHSGH